MFLFSFPINFTKLLRFYTLFNNKILITLLYMEYIFLIKSQLKKNKESGTNNDFKMFNLTLKAKQIFLYMNIRTNFSPK